MAKVCIWLPSLVVYPTTGGLHNPFQLACRSAANPADTPPEWVDTPPAQVLGRQARPSVRALWRRRNTARPLRNAWFLLAALLLALPASAQQIEPPGPEVAYRAFSLVEGWVRAGQAPVARETPADTPPVQGACVTLRLDGKVVGLGSVGGEAPSPEVLVRAAGAAIRRLDPTMSQADRDRVLVSVELSGAMVPFHAADATELTLGVSPGLDGVALARGERYAVAFPGMMLSRGVGPAVAVVALVTELGEEARDALATPAQLRDKGYRIYRFRSVHLAQPRAGAGGVFMHRGGRAVDRAEVTTAGLGSMADAMARYLIEARWPGIEPYGMLGNLHPVTGRYEPAFAGPAEQGVCAIALLRYARQRPDGALASEAERAATEILEALAEVGAEERAPWGDAGSAAAVVLALAEVGKAEVATNKVLGTLLERCRERLREAYTNAAGFDEELPVPVRGIVAAALVGDRVRLGSRDFSLDQLDRAVRAVYRESGPQFLVGQMPWLGWAELELSGVRGGRTPAGPLLREMRRVVWDHQLRSVDLASDDRDLAGGVVFTRGSTPLPTWQVCRPLAFVATMLGRQEFTGGSMAGGEAPAELVRLLESIRFVRQLMADDAAGHMYARPERAAGGVRAALWDQTIAPDATALGLLTVLETLGSIDRLRADGEG